MVCKRVVDTKYNEKFERKLVILGAAGIKVMVLKESDLEMVKEIMV